MTEPIDPDVISSIEILKVADPNAPNGEAVYMTYSADLTLLDALGMLAYTTAFTPQAYRQIAEADE